MEEVRLVVTADFHIHPYRQCSRDGGRDRLMDGLSCLRQSLDLARAERAVWVMAGDFKQPKTTWPQEALTGAHQILRQYGDVEKVMVAGNHDAEGLGGSGLAPFKDVAFIAEQIVFAALPKQGGHLLCAPWNADRSHVAGLLKRSSDVRALIAHGFLAGVVLGPDDTQVPGRGISLTEYGRFPVAFFGDIHKGQMFVREPNRAARWVQYGQIEVAPHVVAIKLRSPGAWRGEIFYPGSPYMQNWGERGDGAKGALLANLSTGAVELHLFKGPRFIQLETDKDDDFEGILNDAAGNFLRIIYFGYPPPALDPEKVALCRSVQLITRRPERQERRLADIHAGMSRKELLQKYMNARPPVGDRERALTVGLRLVGEC